MIIGEKLQLWPLERIDLLKNYQWANDPELCQFAGANPLPKQSSDVEGWANNVSSDPQITTLAIKTKDGNYIGNIELRDIDLRCGCAEIGIIIGEHNYWGKGYGTEAVRMICHFAFDELRMHRLYAKVLASNPRALSMFTKCGFTTEGMEREAFFQNGKYWNIHLLGILDREFLKANQPTPEPKPEV